MKSYNPEYLVRRRSVLRAFVGAGLLAAGAVRAQTPSLVELPERGYRFLPGGAVFAGGAVALPGFEIVHAVLRPWLPLEDGYAFIESHLAGIGRPMQALCGMELRLPRQLTFDEFQRFNAPYVERLIRWGLLVEGRNPVSRTNVVPAFEPPEAPSVHGFSYTVPSPSKGGTFVMAGMTENSPSGIVAAGDVSPEGMRTKVAHVIRVVTQRVDTLGVAVADASHVEFYSAHPVDGLVTGLLAPAMGDGTHRGLRWHYGRPPVVDLEVELEVRNVLREIVLDSR
jgi:hypothetical protein